ncbi:MAG TPA: GNAT family N-acetyltransferase [Candidatus Limnocylindrales bacterium]
MDTDTLVQLEHENMLEWLRIETEPVPGSVIRLVDGVAVYATGLPVALFNQVVPVDGSATVEGLRAAIEVVIARDVPFFVALRRGLDDHLVAALPGLGLELDPEPLPGMALFPIPADPVSPPAGVEIRAVTDAEGLDGHVRAAASGFEMPEPLARVWIGDDLWLRPGCAVYAATLDGRPVASGFGLRTGRTIGVYTIATTPAARGRGIGEAMTRRVVADGAAEGCDVATLQASDMGFPIYERIGFRTVMDRDVWFDPRLGQGH